MATGVVVTRWWRPRRLAEAHAVPVLLIAALTGALGASLSSGVSGQDAPVPAFRTGRDLVTIDATVFDADGRPVTDLAPSEFVVTIDGKVRQVLTAGLFSGAQDRPGAASTSIAQVVRASEAPAGRLVVIAIDRESIERGSERPILDTAASLVLSLSPADAVGVTALPGAGLEATRDHAAAADVVRRMTGARPPGSRRHSLTWDDAMAFEQRDARVMRETAARLCMPSDSRCPMELEQESREMLATGRGQAQRVLTHLTDLLGRLSALRGPRRLVLFSGGIPFDHTLQSLYDDLAAKAAEAHVALFVVHLDQSDVDASARASGLGAPGGRAYATGLGTIAASTGGAFVNGVGRATGAIERILGEMTTFYQLGVDAVPSDADGRLHRVDVKVRRDGLRVRAPSATAMLPRTPPAGTDALDRALSQPTDVADLPLEVATYATHGDRPGEINLLVSASMADGAGVQLAEWGCVVLDGQKNVGGFRARAGSVPGRWSETRRFGVAPGHYRLRTAIVATDGRVAVLDVPLAAALRAAGEGVASDLVVGMTVEGQLRPRARLGQADPALAMIEVSSPESLAGATGVVELTRLGATQAAITQPLELRTSEAKTTVVIAQAALDLSMLPPGMYRASAVLVQNGRTFARVSRMVEVTPGAASVPTAAGTPQTPTPPASGSRTEAARDALVERAGKYVERYGEEASLIVATEHYDQRYPNAPLGAPSGRSLVAEFALVKTGDRTGWIGFRDVVAVDGKPVGDRQDRLLRLLGAGTPDAEAARRLADESARFNIGPTRRNFNDPMAALFFLLPGNQDRFRFTRKGRSNVEGVAAVEIDYVETGSPTFIRTSAGRDVASRGSLWIADADGTVLRTRLVVSGFVGMANTSTVDVTFGRDDRLGLWLPARMTEVHEALFGAVAVTARYSNFKRFETSSSFSIK